MTLMRRPARQHILFHPIIVLLVFFVGIFLATWLNPSGNVIGETVSNEVTNNLQYIAPITGINSDGQPITLDQFSLHMEKQKYSVDETAQLYANAVENGKPFLAICGFDTGGITKKCVISNEAFQPHVEELSQFVYDQAVKK